MPARDVISWIVVLALPLSAPLTFIYRPAEPSLVPLYAWACLAYLGAMSMYLGFFAWNAGLALGGVARVSQVQLLQTFVTLLFASLINGEPLNPLAFAVAGCVLLLIVGARRAKAKSPRSQGRETDA